MELLLQAIEEKLSHVDNERNRWLQYKEEHIQAANNLRDFQKSFRKDILVPIGSKALMPGQLYHTNEIFVGMYSGLFVKCSADKALAVCEHRLDEAAKRLDALDIEHKMYKDRMKLPIDEQVFGNTNDAQEIIEEYNDEEEQKWRELHKIRVREHKKAEAEERKHLNETKDIDIDAIFEQAELMEELESELEQLNVDDDEHLMKYLQASNQQNEKSQYDGKSANERPEQAERPNVNDNPDDPDDDMGSMEFKTLSKQAAGLSVEDKIKFFDIHLLKTREYFLTNHCSIHNFDEFTDKRVTEECLQNAVEELQEALNNNATDTEHKTAKSAQTNQKDKEAPTINSIESRKFHTPSDFDEVEREYDAQNRSKSELLIFYKSQLRNVVKSIAGCSIDIHSRDEKRDLYEYLSDRISSLREEIQKEKQIKFEEDFVDDDDEVVRPVKHLDRPFDPNGGVFDLDDDKGDEVTTGKRKISFASQPITVTFYEDDEPCVVSQENITNMIDSTFQFFNSPSSSSASSVCGDEDDNTRNEQPMNSKDCDINFPMNQFNESTMNKFEYCTNESSETSNNTTSQHNSSTLILQFSHTANICTSTASSDDETINSPLDIYRRFGVIADTTPRPVMSPPHTVNPVSQLNMSHIEDKLMENIGRGEDADFQFGEKIVDVPNINAKPQKSILKNSNLVKNEARAPIVVDEQSSECPEFTQVLGDVVERCDVLESNDVSNQSQPDGGQPKKRVSLFKRSRAQF